MEFEKKRLMYAVLVSYILSGLILILIFIVNQNINSKMNRPLPIQKTTSSQSAVSAKKIQTLENEVSVLQAQVSQLQTEEKTLSSKSTSTATTKKTVLHSTKIYTVNDDIVLNFRKSPDLSGVILREVFGGMKLTYLNASKREDGYLWIKVKIHNQLTGWVAKKYVH